VEEGTIAVDSAACGGGIAGGVGRFDRSLTPFEFPLAPDLDAPPDDEREVSNPFLLFDILVAVGVALISVRGRYDGVLDKRSIVYQQ